MHGGENSPSASAIMAYWRTTGDATVHAATRDNLTALIKLFFKNKSDLDQVSCKDLERISRMQFA
jgi:hypothetical protein